MGCLESTAKYSIFIFNLLLLIAGVILIIVGILDKVDLGFYQKIMPGGYRFIAATPILTIVVGCLTIIVSFLGCLGSFKGINILITAYIIVVVVLYFLQIVIALVAFIAIKDTASMERRAESGLKPMFGKYKEDTKDSAKKFVDYVQEAFQCCGVDGPTYWTETRTMDPPESCTDKDSGEPYSEGCAKAFANQSYYFIRLLGITILVVSAIEVIGLLLAIYLRRVIEEGGD